MSLIRPRSASYDNFGLTNFLTTKRIAHLIASVTLTISSEILHDPKRTALSLIALPVAILFFAGCEPETLGGPGAIYDSGGNPPPVVVPEFTPDHPDFAETIFGTKVLGRIAAKVVEVTEGGSITVLTKGNQVFQVRFAELVPLDDDNPVQSQATASLTKQLIGRTVEIALTEKREGNVTLGWVFLAGENINQSLVNNGLARVDPSNQNEELTRIQSDARSKQVGQWAVAKPSN